MAGKPLHSWYGFSVGAQQANVIDANGNISANYANFANLTASTANLGIATASNLTVNGNLTVTGNITGNLSGNLRAPGADTWVLYTIGGNANSSANFTFTPGINFLHVSNGNLCVDGTNGGGKIIANYFHGDGSNVTNVSARFANTVLSNSQPNITSVGNLTGLTVSNISNVRFPGGNNGQVLISTGNGGIAWSNIAAISGGISNGTSNVTINQFNGPVTISSNGVPNIVVVNGPSATSAYPNVVINSELWVAGNVRANYFDGDGSRLSNINAANIVGNLTLSGSFQIYCRTVNRPIIIERGEFILSKRGDIPTPIRA